MKWSDFLVRDAQFSNFDVSTTKRFSASAGILYPVWMQILNPSESIRVNYRNLIRTLPVETPLMGRFKVRFVTAVSNFKNYCIALEGYNRQFDWRSVVLPRIRYDYPSISLSSIHTVRGGSRFVGVKETSLMDYLGYQIGWIPSEQIYGNGVDGDTLNRNYHIYKSAIPLLMYYDFYRNYLVNPQEEYFPMFRTIISSSVDEPEGPQDFSAKSVVQMEPIFKLDNLMRIVHTTFNGSPMVNGEYPSLTNDDTYTTNELADAYRSVVYYNSDVEADIYQNPNTFVNDCASYHGGLCSTMFDPDINTQWLSAGNFNRLNNEVKVNTQSASSGTFSSFSDIIRASSLWDFISREVYGGGTYADHIYGQFGASVKGDLNIPQIVHVYDSMIDFEDITSQSDTSGIAGSDDNPGAVVGQQFSVGRGYGQSSSFKLRNREGNYAMIMTFMWITPMVDYSTGINWIHNLTKLSDLYVPAFDNYSMQPRLQEQVNAFNSYRANTGETLDWTDAMALIDAGHLTHDANHVIGYQPSFSEYKTDTNRVHGLFAKQLSDYVILRKIPVMSTSSSATQVLSSYVYSTPIGTVRYADEAKGFELAFSIQEEDYFQCQLRVDAVVTRAMSKSIVPSVK